ncbi:hypothetical protein H9P43_002584 [Blastocladiella emersonii ATCC 22665]|nr:hypothetical protein H9P43_002584 [Blastocladiella emersonii ATCC 22665]
MNSPDTPIRAPPTYSDGTDMRWPLESAPVGYAASPNGDALYRTKLRLTALPAGYKTFDHTRGTPSGGTRMDRYLAGHPSGRLFRSPNEFAPHLQWLFNKSDDPVAADDAGCPCVVCSGRTRGLSLSPMPESASNSPDRQRRAGSKGASGSGRNSRAASVGSPSSTPALAPAKRPRDAGDGSAGPSKKSSPLVNVIMPEPNRNTTPSPSGNENTPAWAKPPSGTAPARPAVTGRPLPARAPAQFNPPTTTGGGSGTPSKQSSPPPPTFGSAKALRRASPGLADGESSAAPPPKRARVSPPGSPSASSASAAPVKASGTGLARGGDAPKPKTRAKPTGGFASLLSADAQKQQSPPSQPRSVGFAPDRAPPPPATAAAGAAPAPTLPDPTRALSLDWLIPASDPTFAAAANIPSRAATAARPAVPVNYLSAALQQLRPPSALGEKFFGNVALRGFFAPPVVRPAPPAPAAPKPAAAPAPAQPKPVAAPAPAPAPAPVPPRPRPQTAPTRPAIPPKPVVTRTAEAAKVPLPVPAVAPPAPVPAPVSLSDASEAVAHDAMDVDLAPSRAESPALMQLDEPEPNPIPPIQRRKSATPPGSPAAMKVDEPAPAAPVPFIRLRKSASPPGSPAPVSALVAALQDPPAPARPMPQVIAPPLRPARPSPAAAAVEPAAAPIAQPAPPPPPPQPAPSAQDPLWLKWIFNNNKAPTESGPGTGAETPASGYPSINMLSTGTNSTVSLPGLAAIPSPAAVAPSRLARAPAALGINDGLIGSFSGPAAAVPGPGIHDDDDLIGPLSAPPSAIKPTSAAGSAAGSSSSTPALGPAAAAAAAAAAGTAGKPAMGKFGGLQVRRQASELSLSSTDSVPAGSKSTKGKAAAAKAGKGTLAKPPPSWVTTSFPHNLLPSVPSPTSERPPTGSTSAPAPALAADPPTPPARKGRRILLSGAKPDAPAPGAPRTGTAVDATATTGVTTRRRSLAGAAAAAAPEPAARTRPQRKAKLATAFSSESAAEMQRYRDLVLVSTDDDDDDDYAGDSELAKQHVPLSSSKAAGTQPRRRGRPPGSTTATAASRRPQRRRGASANEPEQAFALPDFGPIEVHSMQVCWLDTAPDEAVQIDAEILYERQRQRAAWNTQVLQNPDADLNSSSDSEFGEDDELAWPARAADPPHRLVGRRRHRATREWPVLVLAAYSAESTGRDVRDACRSAQPGHPVRKEITTPDAQRQFTVLKLPLSRYYRHLYFMTRPNGGSTAERLAASATDPLDTETLFRFLVDLAETSWAEQFPGTYPREHAGAPLPVDLTPLTSPVSPTLPTPAGPRPTSAALLAEPWLPPVPGHVPGLAPLVPPHCQPFIHRVPLDRLRAWRTVEHPPVRAAPLYTSAVLQAMALDASWEYLPQSETARLGTEMLALGARVWIHSVGRKYLGHAPVPKIDLRVPQRKVTALHVAYEPVAKKKGADEDDAVDGDETRPVLKVMARYPKGWEPGVQLQSAFIPPPADKSTVDLERAMVTRLPPYDYDKWFASAALMQRMVDIVQT